MSEYSLVLTLGHNASAIAIRDGYIIGGYEEERFTQKKADSQFAMNSIQACLQLMPDNVQPDVYVNHWFLDGKLPGDCKYWHPDVLKQVVNVQSVYSLEHLDMTHHDGHMHSAEMFAGPDFPNHQSWVIDGFGTAGECISIYDVVDGKSKLLNRFYGFGHSLGMFYQYATSYMGMEMHNHEYKILAYEVHFISNYPEQALQMEAIAAEYSWQWFNSLGNIDSPRDPLLSLDALPAVKEHVGKVLDDVLLRLGFSTVDLQTKRYIASRFTQLYVEKCIEHLLARFKPENLVVSGGFFYNVKINNLLIRKIPGKFCAMPLAGDQGAGLGVFVAAGNNLIWPEHLFWGHRDLSSVRSNTDGIIYTESAEETKYQADLYLEKFGFVNIVRGAMEFGPRALCNTSTIAHPTTDLNYIINEINDRTNEMPMAPVMSRAQADKFFEHTDKVHKSLDYMITALDYKPGMADMVLGAAHYYDDRVVWTGRPQIASEQDVVMQGLLDKHGPLINTSFNYHGVPIVNTVGDIMYTHNKQRSKSENVYTIVQGA